MGNPSDKKNLKPGRRVQRPTVDRGVGDCAGRPNRAGQDWPVHLRFATPMPANLEEQLAALQSEADLDRWFDASQTALSLDAFRAALQNGKRKRKRSK